MAHVKNHKQLTASDTATALSNNPTSFTIDKICRANRLRRRVLLTSSFSSVLWRWTFAGIFRTTSFHKIRQIYQNFHLKVNPFSLTYVVLIVFSYPTYTFQSVRIQTFWMFWINRFLGNTKPSRYKLGCFSNTFIKWAP